MLLLLLAAQLTTGVLLAFSARRAVLLAAASLPSRPADREPPEPFVPLVEVLVACHNEAASLPGLFSALEALDYPREALGVTIVDDASTDGSLPIAQAWVAQQPRAQVLALPA